MELKATVHLWGVSKTLKLPSAGDNFLTGYWGGSFFCCFLLRGSYRPVWKLSVRYDVPKRAESPHPPAMNSSHPPPMLYLCSNQVPQGSSQAPPHQVPPMLHQDPLILHPHFIQAPPTHHTRFLVSWFGLFWLDSNENLTMYSTVQES